MLRLLAMKGGYRQNVSARQIQTPLSTTTVRQQERSTFKTRRIRSVHAYLDNSIHGSRPGHRLQRRRQHAQACQKPRRSGRHQRRDKARALVAIERKRGQDEG